MRLKRVKSLNESFNIPDGVNEFSRHLLADTFQKVNERIPILNDIIDDVELIDKDSDFIGFKKYPNAIALSNRSINRIYLNGKFFGEDSDVDLDKLTTDRANGGRHPIFANAEFIIAHEFGHIVKYYIDRRLWNPFADSNITLEDILDEKLKDENIELGLSGYAKTNADELVAEGFAEYVVSSHPRKIAQIIGETIEEILSRY